MEISLGLDTFGDVSLGPDGQLKRQDEVLREVVEQAVLADQVGIDFIGLGEHHRPDFAISSPEIVLAAIAGRTQRIRLGTAVTVLSSDDPARVFQRFSTLNALSNGRAEPILGRGSFTESYPLFGYDLSDYDQLFEEKLDLFARLVREDRVTWSGQTRSGLVDQVVYPPLGPDGMVVWVGVGGSPESVVRVVRQDLQLCWRSSVATPGGSRPMSTFITAPATSWAGRRGRSACIRPASSRKPMRRRARRSGRITPTCSAASAANAAGRR